MQRRPAKGFRNAASTQRSSFLLCYFFTFLFLFQDEIQDIDAQLQHSGQKLMGRAEQMIKYRKIQHNIEAAMETLSNCLPGGSVFVV